MAALVDNPGTKSAFNQLWALENKEMAGATPTRTLSSADEKVPDFASGRRRSRVKRLITLVNLGLLHE